MFDDRSTTSSSNVRDLSVRPTRNVPSVRGRLAVVGVVLLVLSLLVGGAGLGHSITNWAELTKVIAVALFVTAMVALAMGMIGDSFRRN